MEVVSAFENRPMYFKSREHTPTSAIAATDVNFNSPGHRSSQDGSFIQDDDMHLLLDFGQAKTADDLNQLISNSSSAIVSQSWRGRNAEWATNFDVNVAELDFDDFSASRDMAVLKGARYVDTPTSPCAKIYDLQRSLCNNKNSSDCNHNKIDTSLHIVMNHHHHRGGNNLASKKRNSTFGLGSTGSMVMSSSDGDIVLYDDDYFITGSDNNDDRLITSVNGRMLDVDTTAALLLDREAGPLAFISTDSLDLSSLSINEANLNRVCATNKREYVLTFDKPVCESGIIASTLGAELLDDKTSDKIKTSIDNLGQQTTSEYDNQDSNYYINCIEPVNRHTVDDDEDDDDFTTWNRVKRSYEVEPNRPCIASSKCTSLPNLIPSPLTPVRNGDEERLHSRTEQDFHSIGNQRYELDMSLSVSSEKKFHNSNSENQLLNVPEANEVKSRQACSSSCSSGYATGSSQQQLKNFTTVTNNDNQDADYQPQFVLVNGDDYEYGEFFVNGRYIDVNHNEIGYVPPSTEGLQRSSSTQSGTTVWASTLTSRRKSKSGSPPSKPPRTFTTLLEQQQARNLANQQNALRNSSTQLPVYVVDQSVQTSHSSRRHEDDIYFSADSDLKKLTKMPDLGFMKFPFAVPPLCPSLSPFLLQFLNSSSTTSSAIGAEIFQQRPNTNLLTDIFYNSGSENVKHSPEKNKTNFGNFLTQLQQLQDKQQSNAEPLFVLPDPPKLFSPRQQYQFFNQQRLDSGFGGSTGPSHIQDWESLAALLPKHVVQACSFFKANSNLLGSIDKPGRGNTSPRGSSSKRLCYSSSGIPASSSTSSRKFLGYNKLQNQNFGCKEGDECGRQFLSEPCSLKRCCHSNSSNSPRFESIAEENYDLYYQPRSCCCAKELNNPKHFRNYCRNNHCYQRERYQCVCRSCDNDTKCQRQQQRSHQQCLNDKRGNFCRCCCADLTLPAANCCKRSCNNCNVVECQSSSLSCCCQFPGQDCRRLDRAHQDHERLEDDERWSRPCATYTPPSQRSRRSESDPRRYQQGVFCEDPNAFLQSELLCRPDVDLTGVQRFYSLPNFNNMNNSVNSQSSVWNRSNGGGCHGNRSSMEGPSVPCRTCFRVRSPSTERCYQEFFCDCRTSDKVDHCLASSAAIFDGFVSRQHSITEKPELLNDRINDIVVCCEKLIHAFSQKSTEKCVDLEECFSSAVGALVFNSLCPSVENLLTDGLLSENRCLWLIVQASVVPSDYINVPAQVSNLVRTLGSAEDSPRERSLQFATFINGLLCLRSLDLWLNYVFGNNNLLRTFYAGSSFVRLLDGEKLMYLLENVKRLNVLAFENLNLIDVELLTYNDDCNGANFDAKDASVNEPSCLGKISKQQQRSKTNSTVSLQKELRLTFRVPVSLTPIGLFEKSIRLEKTDPCKMINKNIEKSLVDSVEENNIPMVISLTKRSVINDDAKSDDDVTNSAILRRSRSSGSKNTSPRIDVSVRSISNSIDKPSSKNSSTASTPTKKSKIPLPMKQKVVISLPSPKANLNIVATNQSDVGRNNKVAKTSAVKNDENEKRFVYEKSYVCTTEKVEKAEKGFLTFDFGETLVLLEEYGNGLLRCSRGNNVGFVPRDKVTYISFL